MAEFITTTKINSSIEDIIKQAKKKIVLVSPYYKPIPLLHDRLKEASLRGVKIQLIYGKKKLEESVKTPLLALNNVEILFCDNLHAKCYHNEESMILTSMNLYDFSQQNNREMGLFLNHKKDKAIFQGALDEIQSILDSCSSDNSFETVVKEGGTKSSGDNDKRGHCIRCNKGVAYNNKKPFCPKCYHSWLKFENDLYEEKFCHSCGKEQKTSFSEPECDTCS